MGLVNISFAEGYEELKPDILVVLGDRYEIFSAVSVALVANISIAHIHGGEITEGVFDDAFRHSITKMSHIHFTATDEYKKRVIQLGEEPKRVFNVGGMGIENIKRLELLNKEELEKSINFKFNQKNLLVTFHPVTLENATAKDQFYELLKALDELKDTNIIFTKANSDTDGRVINQMIDEYVSNKNNTIAFTSMGQLRYLSSLQFVDGVVGNSSSGLLEAPSFKIATINIGDRQEGRIRAKSVIDCKPKKEVILEAIEKIYTKDFQDLLKSVKNPYEKEELPSKKIVKILKEIDLDNILKKKFYNISFEGI
jgi:GDP/UDP-N,N'-diacetylbacillosamine 2-epimerase (hydrolysing)